MGYIYGVEVEEEGGKGISVAVGTVVFFVIKNMQVFLNQENSV